MSYDDIMDYLKRNLYSENDIHINERSKFRVYSGDFNIEDINAKTDQIFKIYNNPLCFKFLNYMYKLYLGCEASKAHDKFLSFIRVEEYWNSKFTVNQEYFQFLLKDIFLVIRTRSLTNTNYGSLDTIKIILLSLNNVTIENDNETYRVCISVFPTEDDNFIQPPSKWAESKNLFRSTKCVGFYQKIQLSVPRNTHNAKIIFEVIKQDTQGQSKMGSVIVDLTELNSEGKKEFEKNLYTYNSTSSESLATNATLMFYYSGTSRDVNF